MSTPFKQYNLADDDEVEHAISECLKRESTFLPNADHKYVHSDRHLQPGQKHTKKLKCQALHPQQHQISCNNDGIE